MSGQPGQAQKPSVINTIPIRLSRPVHARLAKLKADREGELRRPVSFTEVIEQLLERAS